MTGHTIFLLSHINSITHYFYLKLKWENLKRVRVLVDFPVHVMAKTGILNSLICQMCQCNKNRQKFTL